MQIKKIFPVILLSLLAPFCDLHAQTADHLKEINRDVWRKFYMAFDSLDHKLMAEIHAKDLIRIPANQHTILDYNTYINNYKRTFADGKSNNSTNAISLRFFERIVNDSVATERGIFKLTIDQNTTAERSFYGQFHVLLVKRDKKWQILMDYDSNENNTIDEEDFLDASPLGDVERFAQQ